MRREPTDAEQRLWKQLRDRQLAGHKFRRQVPIGGFIVDFYCLEQKFAIELDGGQHLDADGIDYDARRAAVLHQLDIRIIRFSNNDVLTQMDSVLESTLRALAEPSPQPSPGLPGEGVRNHES